METMKAAVFESVGQYGVIDVPIPQITAIDQVKIEVEATSICGTDVHIVADPPGYIATPNTILGHEFCGHIVEVGSAVKHLKVGDRVVVNPNNYCGVCVYCRKNLPNLCEHIEALGIDYDGAFAKYCVVNGKVAYKISENVPAEIAACVEPLACAVNGLNKINLKPGDNAVVIGAGPIGMMIAMLLKANGASRVYLLETSEWRSDFAKEKSIADVVINPIKENAKDIIYGETEIGADFVFDVTGSQVVSGMDLVRKGGTLVLFGVNARARSEVIQANITQKEIRVQGTWLANATFPEAIKIVEENSIDMKRLITDVITLDEIKSGVEKLAKGQAVKVVVRP